MNPQELLSTAPDRIRAHRTAEADLRLVDASGAPLPNAQARVRLVRHEFKFGCNAFLLGAPPNRGDVDPARLAAYEARYSALLNYATLPFYWGGYERTPGVKDRDRLQSMADWCTDHHITTKGHTLIWHEVYPRWGSDYPDGEMMARQEARVHEIVSQFRGSVDIWDVVNEATVSHRFDNAIGRWIAEHGAAECVDRALRWAREANPDATLLYNDFNLSADFVTLVHKSQYVLVVGHSDTTPDLINRIVTQGVLERIDERDYSNFYIVAIGEKGEKEILRLKYGEIWNGE